jgi:ABC-type lipoprotein release transport system permease subunit
MTAVLLRARSELRARLRAWMGLAALVGLVSGVTIAAVAAGRRTDSAYQRFLVHQRSADVLLANYPDPGAATFDPRAVERLPQVARSARAVLFYVGETTALAPLDRRLGRDVNRLEPIEGRLPRPDRKEEIAIGFERARQLRLRPGSSFPLFTGRVAVAAARERVPNLRLRVVGLVAAPREFPPLEQGGGTIYLTPAFTAAYARTGLLHGGAGQAVIARLRRGAAGVPAFRAGLERLARGRPFGLSIQSEQDRNVERSIHLQAVALWLLAALVAVTGGLVLAQALARQAFLESAEYATLRAIGMTRRQLWATGMIRAGVVGVIGAASGLALALALSPLAPIGGLARTAEPDPGFALDGAVFALGAAATVAIVLLLVLPSAWMATRPAPRGLPAELPASSALAARLARWGLGPAVVTGVRMALERGRGRTAVPVRTTISGVTTGVAAFAAALTFAASSTHLLDTPRLYGWDWDLAITNYGAGPDMGTHGPAVLRNDPDITGFSAGGFGIPIEIDGRSTGALALDSLRGSVRPPVTEGRAPRRSGEVLLGPKTMGALDVGVGDTVRVRAFGSRTERMRVVGTGVLPAASPTARLGRGAVILYRDVRRLARGVPASEAVLRLRQGTDRHALLVRLGRRLGDPLGRVYVVPVQKPVDIVDFGRVRAMPLLMAALLGILAAATLAHMLVSAVRRRRRDLAVLKTLGFVRGEVRVVVLTQAATYALVAVALGGPLGVALGRWAWNAFAQGQGIVPEVVVPLGVLLLVPPVAVLVALAVGVLPARTAMRTRPALVLRAE